MTLSFVVAIACASFGFAGLAAAESPFCEPDVDCTPKEKCAQRSDDRDCAAAGASPCVLELDRRSCRPPFDCPNSCPWFDVGCLGRKSACEMNKQAYRINCESKKSAQNAVAAGKHAECERAWTISPQGANAVRRTEMCESEKAAQNRLFALQHGTCLSELEIQKLACERNKEIQRVACEAGERGPFRCDAAATMRALRATSIPYVDRTVERTQRLSTSDLPPGKDWLDTACEAQGVGVPQYDAVLSTDGFWTIEVKLESFSIGDLPKPGGTRFLRLVVRPHKWGGGKAHDLATIRYITRKDRLAFSGRAVIDPTPPAALEVHPVDGLEILEPGAPQ